MTSFETLKVSPRTVRYELLLTTDTALSHHDPAVQDDSNRQLFNRQAQLLPLPQDVSLPGQGLIDALCQAHPAPGEVAELFHDLSFPEFVATALARFFLDLYNVGEGQGVFAGLSRYERLEARLRQSAIVAPTLRGWWNRLCDSLQIGIHPSDQDAVLFGLISLPAGLQQMVLRVLTEDYRSIVALARLWHQTIKLQDAEYARKAGQPQSGASVVLHWEAGSLAQGSDHAAVVDVPAVSGNSLRHQVVREPAWLHLCEYLGLVATEPGQGPCPPGVEALFVNGGNIASGAKQPSNPFVLANKARAFYPVLDLLGGVADSFDLGESQLKVAGWLVCRENREALIGSLAYDLPAVTVSAFDLLDDVTMTRQATERGIGQMIMSFETLCAGAQVLCRLDLSPFTPLLTHGALVCAVERYLDDGATLGGQAARGFGHCRGKWLTWPKWDLVGLAKQYEAYLVEHRDSLRQGLTDGTLGTGAQILS